MDFSELYCESFSPVFLSFSVSRGCVLNQWK